MVIEFTSIITFEYVDMSEITNGSDLNVVGGFDEVDAVKCPVWDNMSAMAWFCATGDFVLFSGTDIPRASCVDVLKK